MSRATARKRDGKSLKSSETGMFGSSNNGLQLASQLSLSTSNNQCIISHWYPRTLKFTYSLLDFLSCQAISLDFPFTLPIKISIEVLFSPSNL
ncbi:hypothetical protein Peur_071125 [Populus x canadensis]